MAVYQLNPLDDPRWPEFLSRHPAASVFHTPQWLEVLRRTYGYDPVVYTTTPPGRELADGIPFCRVNSWLTGKRLVSLPFSDHCEPLVDNADDLREIEQYLLAEATRQGWKYVELRPLRLPGGDEAGSSAFGPAERFHFHSLDLSPDSDQLLASFHKTSVVQMIRRAERERLEYQVGQSDDLLRQFYRMLLMTRRKHQTPPQPYEWFCNLVECLQGSAYVHVCSRDGIPMASIITAAYKRVHYYKYGCSDPRYTNLGGTPMLIWKAIKIAKKDGAAVLDMGRTDIGNQGLITFKERWGCSRSPLVYRRCPAPGRVREDKGWPMKLAGRAFSWCPDAVLSLVGRLIYRHVG
ncbi:MAG: lipid II:glycine glycyltransferase FemX [Armatimonadota bacterium]